MITKLLSGTKFTYLLLKYVDNWSYIFKLLASGKRTDMIKIVLRDGHEINFKGIFNLYLFLQLLEKGWKIKDYFDVNSVLICKEICLKIRTSKGFDVGHVDEIYERKAYGRHFSGVVVDVGASNADSSIYFAINGAQKVIALEPFPESYEIGRYNLEINHLTDKVVLLPYALADHDGYTEFLVSSDSPNANSIYPSEYLESSGVRFSEKITVETISLFTLIQKFNINRISLLKMDCEGCEYKVLRNVTNDILDKIDTIMLEYHDYPKDIPDILQNAGFKVIYENKPVGVLKACKSSLCSQRQPKSY